MSRFKVSKMGCGGCASTVEKAVRTVCAGASVQVDLGASLVTVTGDDDVPSDDIVAAIRRAGFPAEAIA